MKIEGKKYVKKILQELTHRVEQLQDKGVTPHIAIVTVGEERTWKVYIEHKISLAKKMGIRTSIYNLHDFDQEELETFVKNLNDNPSIHGIIIQRPLPAKLNEEKIVNIVKKEKDIDGFRQDSPYASPVVQAVQLVAEQIYKNGLEELKKRNVVVIGKGVTGGGPMIAMLKKKGINIDIIDSTTQNRDKLIKNADVIISAVGKKVITADDMKKDVILIGIGARVEKGSLKGDYDEKDIKEKASYYTPTPGGIGPLNLTFLFSNLVKATESQSKKNI